MLQLIRYLKLPIFVGWLLNHGFNCHKLILFLFIFCLLNKKLLKILCRIYLLQFIFIYGTAFFKYVHCENISLSCRSLLMSFNFYILYFKQFNHSNHFKKLKEILEDNRSAFAWYFNDFKEPC